MDTKDQTSASSSPALVALTGIGKRFGHAIALEGIAIEIRAGERHALVGENGAGKSTLIKILSGQLPPDTGTLRLDGKPYRPLSPAQASACGVAVVHQELSIIPDLTVAENIYLGHMPTGRLGIVDNKRLASDARLALGRLGLDVDPGRRAGDLPIAAQQLVEIAKGLARDPRLLILDEPTSSLGAREAARLWAIVNDLNAKGTTILFVSHKLDEVLANADRVTVLRDGASVTTLPTAGLTTVRLVELMVGRNLTQADGAAPATPGATVLQVEGLTRHGSFEDITFQVQAGEIVGFAGLVGAGRTEVMRAIFGLDRADAGRVAVTGTQLRLGDPRAAIAAGLGLVPENRKEEGLFLNLGVRENMAMPGAGPQRACVLDLAAERRMASEHVAMLDVATRSIEQGVATLSGGNQQKVVIARWLARNPAVMIVDEPTRGIDVGAKHEIYGVLRRQARAGRGVIVVSSELPELLALADRIIVMRRGRIVGELDRSNATETTVGDLALGT